ncbi:MAG TPA: DUF6328 family protein [Thermomicrobiales bacterium]|nr:DUF6328 family protein [Thermomicrobiales bacterium]
MTRGWENAVPDDQNDDVQDRPPPGDLTDFLQELRVLLPGAQILTAFLVILPFNSGFDRIQQEEKWVFVATFFCSIVSLVLFTAPAAQHRLERPLRDRVAFKNRATKMAGIGLASLSLALILATYLVISSSLNETWATWVMTIAVAIVIGIVWWLIPSRFPSDRH